MDLPQLSNNPSLVGGDANKALADIFGEGVFNLASPGGKAITGVIDFGNGYVLDITGTAAPERGGATLRLAGVGGAGTPTDGWEYDYAGATSYAWPNGVNQVPAFVGTVLRAKPHNGQPAGVTASFVAIRQP